MKTSFPIIARCLVGFAWGWLICALQFYLNFIVPRDDAHHFLRRRDIGAMTCGSMIIAMFFVLVSLGLGTVLYIQPFRRWWLRADRWVLVASGAAAVASLFIDTHLTSLTGIGFYFLTIFPIINWPEKTRPA